MPAIYQPEAASRSVLILPGTEWQHYESFLGQTDIQARKLMPDFLVISPSKTGTTWLANLLRLHANIFIPAEKELHYFDWGWKSAPLSVYLQKFCNATSKLKGDVTPTYALLPSAAIAAIKRIKPDLKLIMLPRWPPERTWSQLRHSIAYSEDIFRNGPKTLVKCSDEKMMLFMLSDYCRSCNHYQAILARWTRHFDSSAIFVEYFERAVSEPETFLRSLLAFLDLEADIRADPLPKAANVGSPEPAPLWFIAAGHSTTVGWDHSLEKYLESGWGLRPQWPSQAEQYRGWPVPVCELKDGTCIEFDGTAFVAKGTRRASAHYLGDLLTMLEPDSKTLTTAQEMEDTRLTRTLDALFDAYAARTITERMSADVGPGLNQLVKRTQTPQIVGDCDGFNIVKLTEGYLALRISLGEVIIDRSPDDIVQDLGFSNAAFARTLGEIIAYIQRSKLLQEFSDAKCIMTALSKRVEQLSDQFQNELKALVGSLGEIKKDMTGSIGKALNENRTNIATAINDTRKLNRRMDEATRKLSALSDQTTRLEKDLFAGATALQRSVLVLSRRIKE